MCFRETERETDRRRERERGGREREGESVSSPKTNILAVDRWCTLV